MFSVFLRVLCASVAVILNHIGITFHTYCQILMKTRILLAVLLLFVGVRVPLAAASGSETHTSPDGAYTYTTVPGDMLRTRIYTLGNGLKVYMSVNKSEPRIQTMVAVRAGSKYDPPDATGLAHYLEHLLFKGTDTFGTADYAQEKPLLDRIEELYEEYRSTTDETRRTAIYRAIDSVSGIAARYAIANEYDKMVGLIGATRTNAWTSEEQVVYINDIPSNQLERWLVIEGERFRKPVLRLFHTELEAVYEEKNISIDDDSDQAYEELMAGLFPNHPYGTQTTIGTIPHLKNPSIKKIREYYDAFYVPGNMAVILAGDFDPDRAIVLIDQAFGSLPAGDVRSVQLATEPPLAQPVVREVTGPEAEFMRMAYRFPGAGHPDTDVMKMIDMILSNRTAGLIDLNLNKKQKVLHATCSPDVRNDYSVHIFSAEPLEGQSLEEVRDLLLGQIELVKQGKFDRALLPAIINDLRIEKMKAYEQNFPRAYEALDAFTKGMDWEEYMAELDKLAAVTVEDVIRVANQYYGNNYVVVYKRTGERPLKEKVVKPAITPVDVNREATSPFLRNVSAMTTGDIQPRFIDYGRDIDTLTMLPGIPLHHVHNTENQLFSMYYVFDMGRMHDPAMAFAVQYLKYLGTGAMNNEDLSREFYRLGCSFDVSADDRQLYVTLSGLDKHFDEGVRLFESLLADPKPDREALASLVDRTLKSRIDAKKEKSTILYGGMMNYGRYGSRNPFTSVLSEKELKALKPAELTAKVKGLHSYTHRVLYYGPRSLEQVAAALRTLHKTPAALKPVPAVQKYAPRHATADTVFFIDYDMVQAEILWIAKGADSYDPAGTPAITMYNEYYGGGMSSLVFQTIRESKALAYSTYAYYAQPGRRDEPYFAMAYIGTQADKLHEAVLSMDSLLQDMPRADLAFANSKEALRNKLETERILREGILFNYEGARRLGLDRDPRADVYASLPSLSYDDLAAFHAAHVKNGHYTLLILGSKERIDLKSLARYGVVKELTLKDVFGY